MRRELRAAVLGGLAGLVLGVLVELSRGTPAPGPLAIALAAAGAALGALAWGRWAP